MRPKNEIGSLDGVKPRSKYNSQRTRVDGINFDSRKEADFYIDLKTKQEAGIVSHFHRQPVFDLPGGITYRADFLVVYIDGTYEYVDVKGMRTPIYIMKKKQVEALYPVRIREV